MSGTDWSRGSTRAWRNTRCRTFRARGTVCQLRIPGVCTHVATQVHHTKGRRRTGDDPRFLVPACRACNLATGDPGDHGPDPAPRPRTKW